MNEEQWFVIRCSTCQCQKWILTALNLSAQFTGILRLTCSKCARTIEVDSLIAERVPEMKSLLDYIKPEEP